jgi:hypothetical protein
MAVQCASFPTGIVVITPNALDQLTPADTQRGLQRHQDGDWGDLGEEDWKEGFDSPMRYQYRIGAMIPIRFLIFRFLKNAK